MPDAYTPPAGRAARGGAADLMGSSASSDALKLLSEGLAEQRNRLVAPLLDRAVFHIKAHEPEKAAALALEALGIDERSGIGWHVLAIAQEGCGDFTTSLSCYEAALKLLPDDPDILTNLGRLAIRMGMHPVAEQLFLHFLSRKPEDPEGINNLALAMASQGHNQKAIALLKDFISRHPTHANLWNSLAGMLAGEGDIENARVFYREALRLSPRLARARYNLGSLWLDTGDPRSALREFESALKRPLAAHEKAMMTMTRGLAQLAIGRIAEGWENYEARNDVQFPEGTFFAVKGSRWKPGAPLAGASLLLVGEQGLGDEVLFANILPDVLESLGPEGRLTLAVEPRLAALMSRSFPTVRVETHRTVHAAGRIVRLVPALDTGDIEIGCWSPMASLLGQFRSRVEDFPQRTGYLHPAPERVAYWREALAGALSGPKVGLLWKSGVSTRERSRFFSLFDAWEPILRTPGVTFVNLQYDDCEAELQLARERFGVEIWNPPGIDLKQDLDDLTALSSALDLVIGFSNATFNLAAAAGAPAWLIAAKGAWTALGTDRYPWYPQVRLYQPAAFAEWGPVMDRVAGDLAREFGARV
ncbi:MAG: tetratricopeptide repeat protein [Phenylobacterium sp.]|uniref:tetratricopeptide repeat protein n=1 Tax=Phenylobacterium sp. TaxID=1871053 RepID=UPI0025FA3617|nr:tetratricopeptide repeat protein [Phenylobacterium sp.]MCA6245116.1 tetratricopeptide repeat protein [Phenylobacterium sp.]